MTKEEAIIYLDGAKYFDTREKDFSGKETGKIIRSHQFIYQGLLKLKEITDPVEYDSAFSEYSAILKYICQYEVLMHIQEKVSNTSLSFL